MPVPVDIMVSTKDGPAIILFDGSYAHLSLLPEWAMPQRAEAEAAVLGPFIGQVLTPDTVATIRDALADWLHTHHPDG